MGTKTFLLIGDGPAAEQREQLLRGGEATISKPAAKGLGKNAALSCMLGHARVGVVCPSTCRN
jgi:hypothetical protein